MFLKLKLFDSILLLISAIPKVMSTGYLTLDIAAEFRLYKFNVTGYYAQAQMMPPMSVMVIAQ